MTVTTFVHIELQVFASVTVRLSVKDVLHPEAASTETDWLAVLPEMTALPEMLHAYDKPPGALNTFPTEDGQTWSGPETRQPGNACIVTLVVLDARNWVAFV